MRIAFLGAGLIGRPMAERLKATGHSVAIYNRSRDKIVDLSKQGLTVVEQPVEAIRSASCAILMLSDAPAIHDVLLTSPARKELARRTVIQMGTIGPGESRDLDARIREAG